MPLKLSVTGLGWCDQLSRPNSGSSWANSVTLNTGQTATFPTVRPQESTVSFRFKFATGDQTVLGGNDALIAVTSGALSVPVYDYGQEIYDLKINGIAYDVESPFEPVNGTLYRIEFKTNLLFSDTISYAGPFPAGGSITALNIVQSSSPNLTWYFPLNEGSGTAISNSDATSKYYRDIRNVQLQSNNITSPTQAPPATSPDTNTDWPEVAGATATLIYAIDGETGAIQNREALWDGGTAFPPTSYVSPACVDVTQAITPRNGSYCFYSRQKATDWENNPNLPDGYHPRAQLSKPYTSVNGRIEQEKEYWCGFSVYFPSSNWAWETATNRGGMIFEFKGVGGSNVQFPMAVLVSPDALGNPALHIDNKQGGEYLVDWVQAELWTWGDTYSGTYPPFDTWIDFVFKFRISFGATGYVQAWCRNNAEGTPTLTQIIDYSGPTTYYGSDGQPADTADGWYLIAGHYNSKVTNSLTTAKDNLMYFDEWRVAEGTGGGILVDPEYSGGTHP